MTGLEKLTGRILSDAEDFARSLLSSAEAEAAEIKKSAEAKIKNIKSEYAARAEKEEQVLLERAAASASSLARDIVLAAKASLLDEIYGEAKKRLVTLAESGSDEYVDLIARLLVKTANTAIESEKISAQYGDDDAPAALDDYVALFCSRDVNGNPSAAEKAVKKAVTELKKLGKTISIQKAPYNFEGGFILRCGNIEYNCSISSLIESCRATSEGEIYRMLFEQADQNEEEL